MPCRVWTLLAALLFLAAPALAHTGESGFVLLLPTGHYIAGGTLAVLATFCLVFLIPADRLAGQAQRRLLLGTIALPPVRLTSALSALLLAALLIAGFLGSRDPRANPLPIFIWSVWWIGLTLLQALCGDLWSRLNPLRALHALLGSDRPLAAYPAWLGYWPAVGGFFVFAWFELIDLAPSDPLRLAILILLYVAGTLCGMRLYGEDAWLRQADPFAVFFRFVAQLSPLVTEPTGGNRRILYLAWPGVRLDNQPPLPLSGVLFILQTLSSVSFDGLSRTFWWLAQGGINPLDFPGRSAVMGLGSLGLAGTWCALGVAYLGVVALGHLINPAQSFRPAAGSLVLSIIPISLAYHFAHYLTVLLVDLQYMLIALSDPFARGWNLIGFAHHHVTTSFLTNYHSVAWLWNAQAGAIVLGHLLAVALAHLISARLGGGGWRAPLAQVPLAVLMVLYTWFGLWLLAAPNAG